MSLSDGDRPRTNSSPGSTSETDPVSALPSVFARALAFISIFVGAGAGGLIGHAFADIGGMTSTGAGVVTFFAILVGAAGVAVVAVLTLRAFGEWETIRSERGKP